MKFKFAFEKILGHKHLVEDLARRDFIVAQARVNESMKVLKEMYQRIEDCRVDAGRMAIAGGALSVQLGQIDDFINGHKIRIERHRQSLRQLMSEAERLQDILVAAARETKTFEKLREHRLEDFKKAAKKRELKFIDELVTTRASQPRILSTKD